MIELVLGGARSGKSSYAQNLAINSGKQVTYIATATITDDEMAMRIAHHKQNRPSNWAVIEQSTNLPSVIESHSHNAHQIIIIDCLTLWLNNELYQHPDLPFNQLIQNLEYALKNVKSDIILVSNEVGMGIVPVGKTTRSFMDFQGWTNQAVGKMADKVTFIVAGFNMTLKDRLDD